MFGLKLKPGSTGAAVKAYVRDCSILASDGNRLTAYALGFRGWPRCDFGCSGLRFCINKLNSARTFFSVGCLLNEL